MAVAIALHLHGFLHRYSSEPMYHWTILRCRHLIGSSNLSKFSEEYNTILGGTGFSLPMSACGRTVSHLPRAPFPRCEFCPFTGRGCSLEGEPFVGDCRLRTSTTRFPLRPPVVEP